MRKGVSYCSAEINYFPSDLLNFAAQCNMGSTTFPLGHATHISKQSKPLNSAA